MIATMTKTTENMAKAKPSEGSPWGFIKIIKF